MYNFSINKNFAQINLHLSYENEACKHSAKERCAKNILMACAFLAME
jgi:hypothetical protein